MESVVLNNRYRLLELVGSGGMAVVYRGMDTLLQRQVAVKVLRESYSGDPSFLARFRREAQAAASLDHPNVVTVYDVGQDDDWRDLYRQIAGRYVPPEAAEAYVQNTIEQPRGLFRLNLDTATVKTWRMPLEGEAQEGIWHERYYVPGTWGNRG